MSYSPAASPCENCTEDLLIEILSRLPVKSLVRFRAVSKTWYFLIKRPSFVKSQLRHAIASNAGADKTVIVNLYKDEKGTTEDVSFALFNPSSGQLLADLKLPYSRHKYSDTPRSFVVGSDYGVVCVNVWYHLYLWNPVTKQSKRVPNYSVDKYEFFGFGFDTIDSDFKVVMVSLTQCDRGGYSSAVYSANWNCWEDIEPDPLDGPCGSGFQACLHGYLCSIGGDGMVAFDLNREVFVCNVKLPVASFDVYSARITEFKDSIAFIVREDRGDKIRLWTLDDEACLRGGGGTEASWTLMRNIDHGAPPVQFVKGFPSVGDFQLESKHESLFGQKIYKNGSLNVWFCHETHDDYKYMGTLVSIAGSKQVDWLDCS